MKDEDFRRIYGREPDFYDKYWYIPHVISVIALVVSVVVLLT